MKIIRRPLFSDEYKLSIRFLGKWTFTALLSGVLGALIVKGFNYGITFSTLLLADTFRILPVWTIGGALVCGLLIYRLAPGAAGEGVPSYIHSLLTGNGILNPRDTFFKFWAALFTLGTFGNGGVIGPIGRVVAGIMSFLTNRIKRLRFEEWDIRTATICGMAATVGAVFHSSIGGGIFAVEIIQRKEMRYRDLFPAILSSSTAVFISKTLGWESFYPISAPLEFMTPGKIWIFLLFSLFVGLAGKGYIDLYGLTARLFKREQNRNFLFKVIIGSAAASLLAWVINPHLLGTSRDLIGEIFYPSREHFYLVIRQKAPLFILLILMAVVKAVGNCVTVGSGMSAGFAGPAVIIGMLLGSSWGNIFGLPPGSADSAALIAAGFAGMLASVMNIPIAAAVLTIESFGLPYSFPAAVAAVIAFQVNRHETIYDYTKGYSRDGR